ncbi:MAG: winged helix-turn-helix domain-containing protein [Acidobacteriota bacterium]|nr:winged helix-turn-helix domain-containing protein [Acidobacteriota bacterium]
MRKLDFASLITESVEQLREREKKEKDARRRLRVQLLRLLKNKESESIKDASKVCGITPKHGYDLWRKYRDKGLEKYVQLDWKPRRSKLSDEQQEKLIKQVTEENGFASQQEARRFLLDEFNQEYTQAGVSMLFARLKIKSKMPRPKNQKASAEEQTEYKKTLPEK